MPIFPLIKRIVTCSDDLCRNNRKISQYDRRWCHDGHYRIAKIFKRFVRSISSSTPVYVAPVYFRWQVIISYMAKFAKRDRMNRANVLRREKNARPIRLNVATCVSRLRVLLRTHVGFARLGVSACAAPRRCEWNGESLRVAPSFDRCFFRAAGMIRKVTERLEELSLRLVIVRLACQVKLYLPRRTDTPRCSAFSPFPNCDLRRRIDSIRADKMFRNETRFRDTRGAS